jgi:hypothetical protein
MSSLIKYSISHVYRIIKVYALLAFLGALAVVFVQLTSSFRSGLGREENLSFHILSEVILMVATLILSIGTIPSLIEEIKSVLISWRRVQAQFDKEIGHLAEEITPPEIGPRLKS